MPWLATKPPTNWATGSRGRIVADRAILWNSPARGISRSTAVIRWVPRLLSRTAWISSRMTVYTPLKIRRLFLELSSRLRLSGVVIRISGGLAQHLLAFVLRSVTTAGEYPDRREHLTCLFKIRPQLLEGLQQVALHIVVESFQGRNIQDPYPATQPVAGN